ncbi:dha operon transcriptional regulator [Vibrio halioticoli NBRC 102217]|uniref:Dha operon transcriptional regulator n=1 Tax=Vibrio halioticoli NBRC 102217 TaxID=1219072 RepID=V5FDU0_9VIBR|nr:dihydroxyacetone kinase operon transcriptional regulator DhaR [Vibrio halioticoli]GAD87981.1 dha operon transcriptional regulator [Vibrio halioticoli NBRC 102217]
MLCIEESKTRWDFFQKHQWVSPEFSLSPVFQSWQRCVKQMSAYNWSKPHIASGFTLASLRRHTERVINCAITVVEDTYDLLRDEKLLLLVTDDNGCVMFTIGHHELEFKMESLGIKVGCFLSEDKIGTNAVSFAMDTNMPSLVYAGDHFKRDLHDIAAAAAPIIDIYGKLRGTVMMVRYAEDYHTENLAVVSSCAKEVSLQLYIQSEQENMNRLQSAHTVALDYMEDGIISWDSENTISYISSQAEKLLDVHSNDMLDREVFNVIRFAPSIVDCIQKRETLRQKQTTFELNGRFIEAIITYRCTSDSTHLLFLHPIDKLGVLSQIKENHEVSCTLDKLPNSSKKMQHLIKVARRAIKTQLPILITGEEGVGKADLALAIHNESEYSSGPFVTLNCRSTNPYQLIRDALGFDGGEGQVSKFELAQNGTLYIENLDYLGIELQGVILKLLKTGHISRSDSQRLVSVNFQLITSTTADMSELVAKGAFARQLYYEISPNQLHIPPLRKRQEDIEQIIFSLIENYEYTHKVTIELDSEVLDILNAYSWPGNNPQLSNIIEQILLNRGSNKVTLEDVPDEFKRYSLQDKPPKMSILTLEELEKQAIIQSWKVFDGKMQDMAHALDISRTTLWRKVKKYQLEELVEVG